MKVKDNIVSLLMLFAATSLQAQITIGGYVYGGGNAGDTGGNTTVTVHAGDFNRVFGGARMANVSGRAFVNIDGAHEHNYPAGCVLAYECHAVARLYATFFIYKVESCYALGKVAVGESELGVVVAQSRQFPVVAEALLKNLDGIFFHHNSMMFCNSFSGYKFKEKI